MKKTKKVITLNKLVISKLSGINTIMGGVGNPPTCPRPTTCGGDSCANGQCPSKQISNNNCLLTRDC